MKFKNIKEKKQQSLEDWYYIQNKYGVGQGDDYIDDAFTQLLKNPCNQEAFNILYEKIKEYFDMGYINKFTEYLISLPIEEDKKLQEIKERWNL